MKFILVFAFNLLLFSGYSQSWCTPGARWHYSYTTPFWVVGYVKIEAVGTTVYAGKTVQKLQKSFHGYDYISKQAVNNNFPDLELTYEENGVVYALYKDQWDTLYNFNAQIGDQWTLAKESALKLCDSNSRIMVLDTGTMQMNGLSLRFLSVDIKYSFTPDPPSLYYFHDTIVERIGFLHSYIFPFDYCDESLDGNEGGPLRCYSDLSLGTYKTTDFQEDCDFILSTVEFSTNTQIRVFPNPFQDRLQLSGTDFLSYQIFSMEGKKVSEGTFTNSEILLPDLQKGMYILNLETNQGFIQFKIWKD